MKDCIFCKIVRGEIPCEKVLEDKNFLAFFDIHPVGEGHTLIISKKHFNTFIDVKENLLKNYFLFIQQVGKILMKKYNSNGFNLVLNNGESAGQVVGHVHFHILPRKKGDNKRGIFIG